MTAHREVPLSRGKVALVDEADYARVMDAGPWHVNPSPTSDYAQHNVRRPGGGWTSESMQVFLVGGPLIDHVNGNGLDNRRVNLRSATRAQNSANRRRRADSTTGFKGVMKHRGPRPWRAQICANYTKRHLGLFDTAEEAARAYDAAAIRLFGEYASLNFPRETS